MKHPKISPSAANALWLFLVAICHYLLVANLSAQLVGSGGLTGKYYNGTSFNTLAVTRIDPMLDFNWGSGSPSSSVDANNFSVRWTGMIQPRFSEPYYFSVIASQVTANVWINGSLVNAGPVDMKAGQFYSVKIEAVHATGTSASLRLAWESPSQLRETVASECLLPVELTTAYTPIAYPAYQSGGGFVAQWASVGGATGYRLDVATNSAFSGLVSGYNNLDVGNVTSKAVTGLASGKYYYRIRATWSGGTSSNSSTVPVDVVAMTLVSSNTYSTSGSATYTVPAGANRVLVKAWGSGGGGEYSESAMSVGGGGGFVSAAYSITANQTLSV